MLYFILFFLFLNANAFDSCLISNRINIKMNDNLNISTIFRKSPVSTKPPLLLIHGSDAGGWIYEEYWMDYFLKNNISSYSINMRGSYETGNLNKDKVNFIDHVNDLKGVAEYFKSNIEKPILVAHSYGGLVLTKFLEDKKNKDLISGAIWLSSIPPSGEKSLRTRFFFRIKVLKILLEVLKGEFDTDIGRQRQIFYDKNTLSSKIEKYTERLKLDSMIGLNLSSINNNLPNKDNFEKDEIKKLVIGSYNDFIVDRFSVHETAKVINSPFPIFLKESGHNMMLGSSWVEASLEILNFINECF
jgi:pimeloyl-ACP methyl ester carboxylesterase